MSANKTAKKTVVISASIFLAAFAVLLAGCVSSPNGENGGKNGVGSEGGSGVVGKWASLKASGKPFECNVSLTGGENLFLKVFLKGESFKEEFTVEGSPVVLVVKHGALYSLNTQKDVELADCDWLSFGDVGGETSSELFYDVAFYEETGRAVVSCVEKSFGDEKFETVGSVCDARALAGSD